MKTITHHLVEICRLIYERHLSDSAGGNVSVRKEDYIYITPRFMGSKKRWHLHPEDLVVLEVQNPSLDQNPQISREARVHLSIYQHFPLAQAVIHAHPQWLMVFASAGRPLPPTSEQTEKFGVIPVVPPAKAHTQELADLVVQTLQPQAHRLEKHGIACLLHYHGVVVVGRDLDDAYDTLERLEGSARVYLFRKLLLQEAEE